MGADGGVAGGGVRLNPIVIPEAAQQLSGTQESRALTAATVAILSPWVPALACGSAGMTTGVYGLAFTPAKGLHLSADLSLDYLVTATAA